MPKIRSRTKQRWRKLWNEEQPAKFTYQRHKDAEDNVVPDQFIFFNLAGEKIFPDPMNCTQEEALRLVTRLNEIAPKDLGTIGERSLLNWGKQVDERRAREYEQISKENEDQTAAVEDVDECLPPSDAVVSRAVSGNG